VVRGATEGSNTSGPLRHHSRVRGPGQPLVYPVRDRPEPVICTRVVRGAKVGGNTVRPLRHHSQVRGPRGLPVYGPPVFLDGASADIF
jgi:hypothetical protein